MTIKLSLICPVYKVAEFIPELMQSLLAGVNSEQVEIIFVDDCCPEHSIEVCERFLTTHRPEIKFHALIIKQRINQGQAAARNVALKIAKGDYIGFIDSDDVIAPHYWQTLAKYVDKADNDIIEFSFEEFTDLLPSVTDNKPITELPSSNLNPFYTGFFVWTRLYKKTILGDLTFPEGMIYEDIFYNIHAFAKAKSCVQLSSCLVYYRKRAGSTTSGRTSSYSNLLLNMVHSIESSIESFKRKDTLVFQVARYSLLVCLKGFTIKERRDRKYFFSQCKKINSSFSPLFYKFNRSLIGTIKFKLSQLVCLIGAFS
jgi:glycosyltransferase involved in cell wall biosynthesis